MLASSVSVEADTLVEVWIPSSDGEGVTFTTTNLDWGGGQTEYNGSDEYVVFYVENLTQGVYDTTILMEMADGLTSKASVKVTVTG